MGLAGGNAAAGKGPGSRKKAREILQTLEKRVQLMFS